jgi:hypothetical protein
VCSLSELCGVESHTVFGVLSHIDELARQAGPHPVGARRGRVRSTACEPTDDPRPGAGAAQDREEGRAVSRHGVVSLTPRRSALGLAERAARAILYLLLFSIGSGCGSGSKIVPRGQWGGLTLDLYLTDTGGAIVMCCAQVALDQPVVLDTSGRFDVIGTVTASAFFEVGRRMRYFGTVSGNSMILRIETLIPAFGGNPENWFPFPGPEGSDFHYSLRHGVTGTFQHPDGTGACVCTNPMDAPGHH